MQHLPFIHSYYFHRSPFFSVDINCHLVSYPFHIILTFFTVQVCWHLILWEFFLLENVFISPFFWGGVTASLRCNLNTIQFPCLKYTIKLFFLYPQRCNHPYYLILEPFRHPQTRVHTIDSHSLFHPSPPSPKQPLIYFMCLQICLF